MIIPFAITIGDTEKLITNQQLKSFILNLLRLSRGKLEQKFLRKLESGEFIGLVGAVKVNKGVKLLNVSSGCCCEEEGSY